MSSTVNVGGIQFNRKDLLGGGCYGSVFRGKYKGQNIAVKRIEKKADGKQLVDRELNIHQQLDHPNIVKLLHFGSDDDFDYFALELCDASLDQVFRNQDDPRKYKGPLPDNIEVFSQLASGLKYIHSQNLIHRNIKPENILISVKPTDRGKNITLLKWADFGLSREVNERGIFTMSGCKGTQLWSAPEVLDLIIGKNLHLKTKGSIKSDVYAEGLVFGYTLLKGSHIYGENDLEIVNNIVKNESVNMNQIHESHWARKLIEKMLSSIPDERITSEEVVTQLQFIKIQLIEGEQNLHQLCAETCQTSDFKRRIEILIRFGIDLNAKDNDGRSALHYLCFYSSTPQLIDAIKVLIELGIDLNAKDIDGWNALHLLCNNNSTPQLIDAVKVLIELGIDKNAKKNDGRNALHVFCSYNSTPQLIDAIKVLIELGIDLNAKDNDGWNALHLLCNNNSTPQLIDAIKVLIELGIDKNAETNDGRNALHVFCSYNSTPQLIDAIKVLIELGIDLNAKDNTGWNALHVLCSNNSTPQLTTAIKELIELGIDLNAKDKGGMNALHHLCENCSTSKLIDAIQLLIQLGINVNAKDNNGWNALHYLCQNNSTPKLIDAIKVLFQLGIDLNAKDINGWNALHLLCRYNSTPQLIDAIKVFIELGIDLNAKDKGGMNALHHLCENCSTSKLIDTIQLLIQLGININAEDKNGRNALFFLIEESSGNKHLKAKAFRFLTRHGIQVHRENDKSSNFYQHFFKKNDICSKTCFDFLVEEKISLGWHDECANCQQILSITESSRMRLQHHQMFSSCYGVFHLLMKHLEQWAKSNQTPGESELDMSNPTIWLRKKAEQYSESETGKSIREDFKVMADVSEQVKKGGNSSEFNCDNYERFLRSMYSIAKMIHSNESMGQNKWFYLLPFDFPIDYGDEKETDIKRAKIEWDKTLFSWAHTKTDENYGTFLKEFADNGFCLPKEFKHKCHGGILKE